MKKLIARVKQRRKNWEVCLRNMDLKRKKAFTKLLLEWHRNENHRVMPWKGIRDPYRIWLAETILQQTRVEQGWAYYERFVQAFPTLADLAVAPEEHIFRLWQGLGYYNRCRNLLHTARELVSHHGGLFPRSYEQLLTLKGIGPYTAAAIASFAFDLPHAVVDGNVLRVLSRYFGWEQPIDTSEGKRLYSSLANELISRESPGAYNQAIMDLGATICRPRVPLCGQCPLARCCKAFEQGKAEQLPVKVSRRTIRQRYFHYLVIWYEDRIVLQRRENKDIWRGLYEFPLLEADAPGGAELLHHAAWKNLLPDEDWILKSISDRQQQLTHQRIYARFFAVETSRPPAVLAHQILVHRHQLTLYAFPGIIIQYLRDGQGRLF